MKKHWMTGLAVSSLLVLGACAEEEQAPEESTEEETEATEETSASEEEQTETEDQEASEEEAESTTEEENSEGTTTTEEDSSSDSEENESSESEETDDSSSTDNGETASETNATVTNVVDGDTIDVQFEGSEERIRLILVDTPETKHPQKGVQPFGPEASEFTTSRLSGKDVTLELGIEERDRYGRLLAYVFLNGENFNERLLSEGLGRVAVYPPNTEYLDEFRSAEAEAKAAGKGIWSLEDYVTDDGYQEEESSNSNSSDSSSESNSSDSSSSGSSSSDSSSSDSSGSSEEVSYQNCDAVRAADADPIHEGDPGYDTHLDRDGDGIGCE